MYEYFSIEGLKEFAEWYFIMGVLFIICCFSLIKNEKTFKDWLWKVLTVITISSIVMYSFNYYFQNKDYKKELKYCKNTEYVMVNRNCYKPIGDNHYVRADTIILTF